MTRNLDLDALDNVNGGLNAATLNARLGAPGSHPLGVSHVGPTIGLQPTTLGPDPYDPGLSLAAPPQAIALPTGATGPVAFSATAVNIVDSQHGTLANYAVPTTLGTQSLASLADQLARSTNGAITYAGDLNHDGRIGAADFVHHRSISEQQAAAVVGNIMDQLHLRVEQAAQYANGRSPYGYANQPPVQSLLNQLLGNGSRAPSSSAGRSTPSRAPSSGYHAPTSAAPYHAPAVSSASPAAASAAGPTTAGTDFPHEAASQGAVVRPLSDVVKTISPGALSPSSVFSQGSQPSSNVNNMALGLDHSIAPNGMAFNAGGYGVNSLSPGRNEWNWNATDTDGLPPNPLGASPSSNSTVNGLTSEPEPSGPYQAPSSGGLDGPLGDGNNYWNSMGNIPDRRSLAEQAGINDIAGAARTDTDAAPPTFVGETAYDYDESAFGNSGGMSDGDIAAAASSAG
jgi:hypothetical protein